MEVDFFTSAEYINNLQNFQNVTKLLINEINFEYGQFFIYTQTTNILYNKHFLIMSETRYKNYNILTIYIYRIEL